MSPSPNGSNGRCSNGQFAKGNHGGPGNPFAQRAAELRSAMFDAVTVDDLKGIVTKLVKLAQAGDVTAAKLILDRTIGKPVEPVLQVQDNELEDGRTDEEQTADLPADAEDHPVAFSLLADGHHQEQFRLLGLFWFARAHSMCREILDTTDPDLLKREFPDFDLNADHLDCESSNFIADVCAFRFCTNQAAWLLFRDELRISPDALRVDDVLYDLARENVSRDAPSAAKLLARYPDRFPPHDDGTPFKLVTPADVCESWRETFGRMTGGGA